MVGYYLFIGGPWDGERHQVDGRSHWVVAVEPPLSIPLPMDQETPDKPKAFETVAYTLRSWNVGGRWFNIYADEIFTNEVVMLRLMDQYTKGSQ